MSELPTSRILLLLLLPYPFVFIFNADSRAEGVEFPTLYASRLSDIFFNASFCRFGRFRFGCFKKGREWVEQGFSKKKYYPQGWRFFLKTIEHPNPGFTFAPRTGTIHLMRLLKDHQNGGKRMWRHIGYEMFREKKERKSQKEGIRRKRETGKHSKKVCCNRVAKPV